MKNKFLNPILNIVKNLKAQEQNTFKDKRDGKIYETVKIGNQIWMAENLAYKASGGCWAYKNDESNVAIYGYLYDWETAIKACPRGWHLPSEYEWQILISCAGGTDVAGYKLKSEIVWKGYPHSEGGNWSGFSALPAGLKYEGSFIMQSELGRWWSDTKFSFNDTESKECSLYYNSLKVRLDYQNIADGSSVRCLKN